MTKSGWNGELPFIDAASVYTLGEVEPLPLPRTCMYVRYSTLGKRTSGVQDKRTGVCIWKGKVIANSLQTHCKVWSGDWGGDQHAWYFWSKEWGDERTQWYQGWDLIVLQIEEIGPLHSGKGSLTNKLTVVLWWRSEEWGVRSEEWTFDYPAVWLMWEIYLSIDWCRSSRERVCSKIWPLSQYQHTVHTHPRDITTSDLACDVNRTPPSE